MLNLSSDVHLLTFTYQKMLGEHIWWEHFNFVFVAVLTSVSSSTAAAEIKAGSIFTTNKITFVMFLASVRYSTVGKHSLYLNMLTLNVMIIRLASQSVSKVCNLTLLTSHRQRCIGWWGGVGVQEGGVEWGCANSLNNPACQPAHTQLWLKPVQLADALILATKKLIILLD